MKRSGMNSGSATAVAALVAALAAGVVAEPRPADCFRLESTSFCCETSTGVSVLCGDGTGGISSFTEGTQIWTCVASPPDGHHTSKTCNGHGGFAYCFQCAYGCVPSGGTTTYRLTGLTFDTCYSATLGAWDCDPLGP